ncbi:hypothetical protein HO133_002226 [Letharia lupina]|uniref:Leucine rich repeat protein n=1 Tax=Letharia lupina TaxID=560253 RepID=A0A8H6CDN9_9LECA|nr:uncharacterized protein HO133_002226 [Letharia lupina]KAF6221371.1 hypothetical protein HO133_002226 [Letharia lupina]
MGRLTYINVKRIPPSAGSKAAFRDPVVELDVSGKGLTDEGFAEVASALVESLNYDGDQGRIVRLEELCLTNNRLSATSLQALSPIIRLASNDLRDLDLSGNSITINTEAEVAIWEDFLMSFSSCCLLRRIDLSRNAWGPRVFEVMIRVYAKQEAVDLVLPADLEQIQSKERRTSTDIAGLGRGMRRMRVVSDPDDWGSDEDNSPKSDGHKGSRHGSKFPQKAGLPPSQLESPLTYATTRGLRSVPYIVLSNSEMTEAGALHLSYILAIHHVPKRLLTRVPHAKAGASAQQLLSYDQSQCRGIIYLPNPLLGSAGHKVLELAEVMRDGYLDCLADDSPEFPKTPIMSTNMLKRASGSHPGLGAGAYDRRCRNTASTGLSDQAGQDGLMGSELDRARSRIQGTTLQHAGPQSNDLWRAAFKMLSLGREIRPQTRNEPLPRPPAPKTKTPIVRTLKVPGITPKTLKPLTPLTLQRDPNQLITPWTTQFPKKSGCLPSTPIVIPLTPLTPRLPVVSAPLLTETAIYRTKLPCGLPEYIWRRILGLAAGAEGIMSVSQQQSVLKWAMDRKTLRQESESLGLRTSAQCWKILEATGCLAYEMDKP